MTKVDCNDCDKCDKCKKDEINLLSPVEILGWLAILIGIIGSFFQLKKSRGSRNLSSFSKIYLISTVIADSLFVAQAIMTKNVSLALTKVASVIYFSSFIVMFYLFEKEK